jgi:REP element-mobilizing transposase RayT
MTGIALRNVMPVIAQSRANTGFARTNDCPDSREGSAVPRMDSERWRKATRLRGYDYRTPALYHVVTTTQGNICRFGEVRDGLMIRNLIGDMIEEIWNSIPEAFPRVSIDGFIVMPNHMHGIVFLEPHADDAFGVSLGDVMKWFKAITTTRYSHGVHDLGWPPYDRRLWQRNYYDHIVRDDRDLERIRAYIEANTANWNEDRFHLMPG